MEVYPSTQKEYEKDETLVNKNNTMIAVAMHEIIHEVEIALENNGILFVVNVNKGRRWW